MSKSERVGVECSEWVGDAVMYKVDLANLENFNPHEFDSHVMAVGMKHPRKLEYNAKFVVVGRDLHVYQPTRVDMDYFYNLLDTGNRGSRLMDAGMLKIVISANGIERLIYGNEMVNEEMGASITAHFRRSMRDIGWGKWFDIKAY